MNEVVELTEEAGLTDELIRALVFLGNLQHRYGTLAQALETTQRVLSYEPEIEDPRTLAQVLNDAAMLNFKLGHLDEVPPYLERALPIFREVDDENGIGTVFRIYGNYHNALGEVEKALDYYRRARVHYVNTNNVHDYANISFNMGLVFLQAGSPAVALPHLQNAVENFTAAGSISGAGMAGTELGRALFQLRRYAEAERVMAQARRHLESSQSFLRLAQAHAMYGAILFTQGDSDTALAAYGDALRLYRRLGMSTYEQRTLETMMRIRQGTQGDIEL
ncbi:MAG: tetratricopeptide repeat protein [Spirochaetaceae bacterium]|nr:MAG: tetratricopeptide repeat protein [Spirochaetaceae bacterium]